MPTISQTKLSPSMVLALFLALLPFHSASAQVPQAAPRYPVRGTVLNSVTGEPIHGALVQIYTTRQRSVLTGADGAFQFAEVPAGTVNLGVQKPGYFTLQAIQSPRAQAVFAVSGPDQPPVVIKLVPEAVISGHVTGDGGEPVENFPVQVLAERIENGKRMRAPAQAVQTNEEGEFRLAELQPGKYFIFAGSSSRPDSFIPGAQPQARGYPASFYPNASELAGANAVEVTAGQRVELNFDLRSQPFHRISGTVSGYPQNSGVNIQVSNAAGQQTPVGLQFNPATGTFRTQWMAAGAYTLTLEARDPQNGQAYFAAQKVNLTTDLAGVHLQLLPGLNIAVNARVEKTRSDSPEPQRSIFTFTGGSGRMVRREMVVPVNVYLQRQDGPFAQPQFAAQVGETEGSGLQIEGVPPGVYSVQVAPNGPWYVQSARSGSLNLLTQNLTVEAGSAVQPIEIVLRDDFATLSGSVALSADTNAATLIAIPEGGQPRIEGIERALTPTGTNAPLPFEMQRLAPGTYKVFAVDRPDDFEYGNPEVLRKYSGKMREITLEPNQQGKVELDLVHVGE